MSTVDPVKQSRAIRFLRLGLRFVLLFACVFMMHLGIESLLAWAETRSDTGRIQLLIIAALVVTYALSIAIPFVPGVEIALSLLMIRGSEVAPLLYLATITGLSLAYFAGRLIADETLVRLLNWLHLTRPARFVADSTALGPDRRLALMRQALPSRVAPYLIRSRYLVMAALFNLPGNVLIGGGGGIAMMAGLSRVFAPVPTMITIALAVLPVPLAVWFFSVEKLL